jgi:DnaD/phage-associated family protein
MTTPVGEGAIPAHARRIPMPAVIIGDLLAEIDDIHELKLILRGTALLAQLPARGGVPPSLGLEDLREDAVLQHSNPVSTGVSAGADFQILRPLAAALRRGIFVAAKPAHEVRIFLNDDHSRRYFQNSSITVLDPAAALGSIDPPAPNRTGIPDSRTAQRANIVALYEKHIGTLNSSTRDALAAAEEYYPNKWIEDAIGEAAKYDGRNWAYVEEILRRWLTQGPPRTVNSPDGQQRQPRHEYGKPGLNPAPDRRTGYLDAYRRRFGPLPWETEEGRRIVEGDQ